MIDNNILKCNGQCPKLIHALAMLTKLFKHVLSLMIAFRCFQDTLSGPSIDELLHLTMELLNSLTEKVVQIVIFLVGILSIMSGLISQFCAELNICYKTC